MASDHALVHLDSRRSGVSLPAQLLNQHTVCLKLSYNFQGRTSYDDEGVTSFLRFDGNYFECIIPWTAVWGMSSADGKRYIWPTDLPAEILFEIAKTKVSQVTPKIFKRKKKDTPAVKTEPVVSPSPVEEPKPERTRPALRRIK